MSIITPIIIAIAVCLDSFAVAVTVGIAAEKIKLRQALKAAVVLATIQGIMPVIGWLIGTQTKSLISSFDHWIGFGLLLIVGARMVWEGLKPKKAKDAFNPFALLVLITLAIASSIDALIVGVSFAYISANILTTSVVIFTFTFVMVMTGIYLGKRKGELLGDRMEILGGVVLILIGISFLVINWWF